MRTKTSRSSLEQALEATSAAFAVARVDWRDGDPRVVIRLANRAAYDLTRTAGETELARFLATALRTNRPRPAGANASPGVSQARGAPGRVELDYDFEREPGEAVYVRIELSPISDGPVDEVAVYIKDITPGRTIHRQLEWLSALPEANPNIVMIAGCPDRIEYVNATGRAWLGERGLDSWEDLRRLLPPQFAERICALCDRREKLGWTIAHDGRTYDVRKTPLADEERCMITVNDVTDLVELTRTHEIFYRAFQGAHTPIMITDSEGRIEYVNAHFEALYGYTAAEILGNTPKIVNPGREAYRELGFSDDDYDALFRGLWEALTNAKIGYWEHEIPNRTADGRIVWVRLLIHAVRDETGAITSYIGFPVDITDSRERELHLRLEAYEAIADLAELRDNETGNHIKRVGRYAMELANRLGHSKSFQEELLNFAPLHDIGKVGISDEILLAPRRLSEEEFGIMKRHTVFGFELFRDRPSLETAASIAHAHHERWDGTGYPLGLAGAAIPLCARIVSVCDVYDALRSERPYKAAWPHEETVAFIRSGRGTQFDPEVVDAFLSCQQCIESIRDALPDDGSGTHR